MKYQFQFHGNVRNKNVFTIVTDDETNRRQMGIDVCFHHFVQDQDTKDIKQVSYMDTFLISCNTTHHEVNSTVNPSHSQKVTKAEAEELLALLQYDKVVLPVIGDMSTLVFEIRCQHLIQVDYEGGRKAYHYYEGVSVRDALQTALINNGAAMGVSLCEPENEYAKIYSVFGLEQMIEETEKKIRAKKKERADVGLTWTEAHCESHYKWVDKEIIQLRRHLAELNEALAIKKRQ